MENNNNKKISTAEKIFKKKKFIVPCRLQTTCGASFRPQIHHTRRLRVPASVEQDEAQSAERGACFCPSALRRRAHALAWTRNQRRCSGSLFKALQCLQEHVWQDPSGGQTGKQRLQWLRRTGQEQVNGDSSAEAVPPIRQQERHVTHTQLRVRRRSSHTRRYFRLEQLWWVLK